MPGKMKVFFLTLLLVSLAGVAPAALVTSADGLAGPQAVIDFSEIGSLQWTNGPVQVGSPAGEDIVWTSTQVDALYPSVIGLYTSYAWAYVGLNSREGTMTFTFNSGPQSGVGGLIHAPYLSNPNYGPDLLMSVYGSQGNLLESHNVSTEAPFSSSAAEWFFRGISRPSADIYQFTISNHYVNLTDLTFSGNPVPLPGGAMLLSTGLLGLGAWGWRRRKG